MGGECATPGWGRNVRLPEITAGLLPWYLFLDDIYELHFTYNITMASSSSDIRKCVFKLFEIYVIQQLG